MAGCLTRVLLLLTCIVGFSLVRASNVYKLNGDPTLVRVGAPFTAGDTIFLSIRPVLGRHSHLNRKTRQVSNAR